MKKESNTFHENSYKKKDDGTNKNHHLEQEDQEKKVVSQEEKNEEAKEEMTQEPQKTSMEETSDEESSTVDKTKEEKISALLKKKDEYFTKMQRVAADFENFKKRVQKERETTYKDALAESVLTFLPVVDTFERALKTPSTSEDDSFRKGMEMVFRQFEECFQKLGVRPIDAIGKTFDPALHNAVMHIEDEGFSDGEIIEEFQKGYTLGEKVVRHSMVKVAN